MAVNLSPIWGAGAQLLDNSGNVLSGGKIYTYAAGTTTQVATYTSNSGITANSNPIILNSAGRVPYEIWLLDGQNYKFVLKDSNDVLIGTWDNLSGINSNFVAYTNQQEIQTATAGQTVFNLTTMNYLVGTNSLSVFVDGVNQYGPGAQYAYEETDSNTVTFASGLHVGAEVKFTSTQTQNAGVIDASQVGYLPPFTDSVATNVEAKLAQYVSVKDFGAVGDFDPSTGVGTDDRAAIQAAFDYAITVDGGCTIVFPSGRYYTGTGYGSYAAYGVILSLGTMSAGSAQNIRIIGEGAEIYQGAAGRCLAVFGAFNVSIENLKMYGYTGGTLGVSRGNDALITLNYNSQYVTISNCYLTNGLGDCIYIGGSLDDGALTGYETRNVIVCNNTLKERYGNGVRSDAGGTKSRTAMAVIDCIGLDVYENKIYGNIDLEPNGNGQYLASIAIKNNRFLSGTVTAQSTIGTAYWYDEPVVTTGGSTILQSVTMTGVAASPVVTDCVVENNTFQDGLIVDGNPYRFDSVAYNFFVKGQIRTGYTSGSNNTAFRRIVGNTALNPYSGEVTFIRLDGNVTQSVFAGNVAQQSFTTCINNNGASTGDNGRCTFVNNENIGGTSVIGLTLAATSTEFGSISSGSSNNFAKSNLVQFVASYSPMVSTTSYATGSYTISWSTYRSNTLYITQNAAAAVSITDITGELGDGHEVTLISGASAGGTTTIVYNASLIRPKGNVDAVMSANNMITFVNRSGIWFEKSRSF